MVLTFAAATSVQAFEKPVLIAEQGSFAAGGTVVRSDGSFNYRVPSDQSGQSLHGDHAYVFYQKPAKAHKYPLVFLHGAGQSAKTWETTPDGRDGFQNIFYAKATAPILLISLAAVERGSQRRQKISVPPPMTSYGSAISGWGTGPIFLREYSFQKIRKR